MARGGYGLDGSRVLGGPGKGRDKQGVTPLLHTNNTKVHFTHKTEGPWPLQSKSSHWLKGQRPSKFTSHTKVKA